MYSHNPLGASPPSASQVKAKLPKLTLPKFRGDLTNWMSFWDSFESAVHKNPSISKVDKFNYLNSLLEGAARRAVQGLTLTEANYDSAVEILRERYGRPQQIISAHMDELIKLQPSHNDRPASLRYIYDRISVHVRGLASLINRAICRGTQRHFSENICSEDDLRSRIFGTFVVKFLACLPVLGFSNFQNLV